MRRDAWQQGRFALVTGPSFGAARDPEHDAAFGLDHVARGDLGDDHRWRRPGLRRPLGIVLVTGGKGDCREDGEAELKNTASETRHLLSNLCLGLGKR